MANIRKKDSKEEEVLLLRIKGDTIEDICKATNLTSMEVVDIIAKAGSKLRNLIGIKQEAIIAHSGNNQQQRLLRLSFLRDSLQKEIERRSLEDIPIDKLINLYLKTEAAIERNITPPIIHSSYYIGNWEDEVI